MKGILQPAAARGCGRSRAHLRRRADAPRDRRAIAKRHFVRRRCKTALCGERRGPSPGLARDPSSVHPRASAVQLRPGVQPLRGLGSGAVPLRCRTIAVRMRLCCGRLAAAEPPSVVLRAARGCDDAAAVRACVRNHRPLHGEHVVYSSLLRYTLGLLGFTWVYFGFTLGLLFLDAL